MTQPNSLDDSAQAVGEFDGSIDHGSPNPAVLAELRNDLGVVVADLKEIVARRTAEASAMAQEGMTQTLDAARFSIRAHPILAIGVAVLLGAGAAVALTRASGPARAREGSWSLPARATGFVQSASEFPGAVMRTSALPALSTAFERLVDAISTIDPKSPLGPAWEKATSWLADLKSAVTAKR